MEVILYKWLYNESHADASKNIPTQFGKEQNIVMTAWIGIKRNQYVQGK